MDFPNNGASFEPASLSERDADPPEDTRVSEFEHYSDECRKWDVPGDPLDQLTHAAMGLVTEAAEILDLVMKCRYRDRAFTREELTLEIGDAFFEIHHICRTMGISPEVAANENLAKLSKRHGASFQSSYLRSTGKHL